MTLPTRTAFVTAALLALAPLAASAQDSTRTSVDWDGTYAGVVPCASCPGIDMTLELHEDGTYRLAETYQESKDATFVEKGSFTWDTAGRTITLDDEDKRVFFVTEGAVEMVGADGKPGGDAYRLAKAEVTTDAPGEDVAQFVGEGANLQVDRESIAAETRDGAPHVRFHALHNFEHEMEGGHRSMLVEYDINCADRTVAMPEVSYFADADAGGQMLDEATGNDDRLPLIEDGDDVVRQAADQFCK